jgi:hypothetical protein
VFFDQYMFETYPPGRVWKACPTSDTRKWQVTIVDFWGRASDLIEFENKDDYLDWVARFCGGEVNTKEGRKCLGSGL